MTLPATIYASTQPSNPAGTVSGHIYRVELTNIPALAAWWAVAENTNKNRGRAGTTSTGAEYATYWHKYDHAGKHAVVYLLVPSVLAAGAPQLDIYPPVAANSAYLTTDTYGRDAVWSNLIAALVDGTSDASGNGRNFVAEAGEGITSVAGKVDNAVKFVNAGSYAAYDTGAGGISGYPQAAMAWVKADDWMSSSQQYLFGIGSSVTITDAPYIKLQSRGSSFYRLEYNDGSSNARYDGGTLGTGWVHLAWVLSSGLLELYVDSVFVGSVSHSNTAPSLRYLLLGNDSGGWQGLIDQAWFFDAAPSADWIAYYHAMTSDPASFYGAWTTGGASTAPDLSMAYSGSPLADGGSIDLGASVVRSDTPMQITVTVTNDGDGDAGSIVVTPSGDASDAGTGTLGSALAASASGTVVLDIDISAAGTITGGCSIASDDADSPLDFTITGTVVAPSLSATHKGSPVADGGTIDLGTSIVRTDTPGSVVVSITNNGGSDAGSIVVTASGDASDTGGGTLGSALGAGASGTIELAMDYSASGAVAGGLSIASDDPASPLDMTITGTVIAPVLGITRGATDLNDGDGVAIGSPLIGSAIQITLTAVNSGDSDLHLGTLATTGDVAVNASSNPSGTTLGPGASAEIKLDVATAIAGPVSGTLAVPSDDAASPFDLTFSGTVTAPELAVSVEGSPVSDGAGFNAGAVDLGSVSTVTLTVTNDGDAQATGISVSVTGDASVAGGTLGQALAPAASGTVIVALDTAALGAGAGAVEIPSSDPAAPFNVTINFEVEDTMPAPVVINSSPADGAANAPADLSAIVLLWIESVTTGTGNFLVYKDGEVWKTINASVTSIDSFNTNQQTIPLDEAPGHGVVIHVLADAGVVVGNASGLPNAAITDPTFLSFTTQISGPAQITITELPQSGGTIEMGEIALGAVVDQAVTINNSATPPAADLLVGTMSITGDGTIETDPSNTSVAAGGSAGAVVRIDTSAAGPVNASLSIPSNDAGSPFIANISAAVVGPRLGVTAGGTTLTDNDELSIGQAGVGDTLQWTATLQNTGLTDLSLGTPVVIGDAVIDPGTNPANSTLAPGQTAGIALVFNTSGLGPLDAALSIPSDDPASSFDVTISGSVTARSTGYTGPSTRQSYLDVAEADALIAEAMASTLPLRRAWEASGTGDKMVYLANASIDFDSVPWDGLRADRDQPTAWPRIDRDALAILPMGEPQLPAGLDADAWSFAGLPREIRIGVALQGAAHAAHAMGIDQDFTIAARAAKGITGLSGAGVAYSVDPVRARQPSSVLHWSVIKVVARYMVRTVSFS